MRESVDELRFLLEYFYHRFESGVLIEQLDTPAGLVNW